MKTVVAIYRTMHQAEAALRALVDEGVARERISLAAPRRTERGGAVEARVADVEPNQGVRDERQERAALGATFGGVGGVLAGLIAFSIPGIGPAIGLGPMAIAMGGTAIGTVGGVIGALVGRGMPRKAARVVEEGLTAGWILVGVDVENNDARAVEDILERFDPVDTGVGALREGIPIRERDESDLLDTALDGGDEYAADPTARGYDEAVNRVEGGPADTLATTSDIAVDDNAEDRYDEGSDAGTHETGLMGFGRSLGAETSDRASQGTRGGDLNASSDLSLTVTSGATSDEALDPASDVRVQPVGEEEVVDDGFGGHPETLPGEVPARADDDLDVNLGDEVLHNAMGPEGSPRPDAGERDAERATTPSSPNERREGVEPDEDRLPSPTGR